MTLFATRQLVWLTGLRHIARHKARTLLTLFGVVAGVATFVFAPSLAASIAESLRSAVEDMTGRAELEVRGPVEGFNERALRIARAAAGVSLAAPATQTGAAIAGRSEPLAILGIDPNVDREVRSYTLASGVFLDRANGVLITERYAREQGIRVGEHITLIAPGGSRRFTVIGTLADGGVARLNSGDLAVMRLRDAQDLRGERVLDSIAIRLKPGNDLNALAERLRRALPDALEIDTPEARRRPLDNLQAVVNFMMSFTSLLIIGLGSTLVYNTMAVAVAQRRAEIGVLRALGVPQSGVRAIFLIESGVLGLIGSVIGIGIGYALVQTAGQVIDLTTLYSGVMGVKIVPEVPAGLPVVALITGTGTPMLAGFLPSRAAARVDPVEALAGARSETEFAQSHRRREVLAVMMLAACAAVFAWIYADPDRGSGNSPLRFGLIISAVFSMVGGVALLMSSVLAGLGRIAPPLMHRLFGAPGLLAAESLTKRPRRMTATAIVLMVSAWAAVVTSATNFGYHDFVAEWDASENVWDLIVSGAGPSPFKPTISLPTPVVDKIARRLNVAATVAERVTTIDMDDAQYDVRALDVEGFRGQGARLMWSEGDEAEGYRRLPDARRPAMAVSSFTAVVKGVRVGDALTLDTPSGPQSFEIVGTVLGAIEPVKPGSLSLILDREVYRRLWHDDRIDRLLIKLKPGSDAQAERRAIQKDFAESGVVVISPADLSAALDGTLRNIVIVGQILSLLLLVTLTLGIANTLVINVLDRRREMGTLRAIGLRGREVAIGVMLETALLVAVASALAVPMGIFTNHANTLTMQDVFAIRFTLNAGDVIRSLGLVLLSALLASYFPARQAGKVDVLEALRYE